MLLDSGSQTSFVTRDFVKSLGLRPREANISISGIGGTSACSNQAVFITLKSRLNNFFVTIDCMVTDRITEDLPAFTMKRSMFNFPRNLPLADPSFNVSSKIDILIGAEAFWNLICVGQIKASDCHLLLQKTKLGWILAGKMIALNLPVRHVRVFHSIITDSPLHDQLAKFWRLEDIPSSSKGHTPNERQCESHFMRTVSRNTQDRYIVQLPFKHNIIADLGDFREVALKRFLSLERRLTRDTSLKSEYSEFLREYLSLGHMRPIREEPANEGHAYYLPHHCVVKEQAKSTKLRVVFDGSCKSNSGSSLNDCMFVGPVVQDDLSTILLRFRTFKYVLIADIVKMYRQVLVHPDHTLFRRILWRQDKTEEVQAFELLTVTYGTAAASYLATRCIVHLANLYANEFPIGSLHIRRDFYVDDLLTDADSKSEALAIRDQVIQILSRGCFELSNRVAPIKALSLPRLELSAALLLSQLLEKVKASIELSNVRILLWSNSTVTLNWITSSSRRWSTFVANRVGEIQRLTELSSWRHISSSNNPADVLSRGMLPDELINSHIWWHGPDYLTLLEAQWPCDKFNHFLDDLPEERMTASAVVTRADTSVTDYLVAKFSKLDKICRVLAYCLQFARPTKLKPLITNVSLSEVIQALNVLCKSVQRQFFLAECQALAQGIHISSDSKLNCLTPFLDEDGILRVGGRLKHSDFSSDARHPILLPRSHLLTI